MYAEIRDILITILNFRIEGYIIILFGSNLYIWDIQVFSFLVAILPAMF